MNNKIKIKVKMTGGYLWCKASWGEFSCAGCAECTIEPGITLLHGDVDSAAWGISYAISMFDKNNIKTQIWPDSSFMINDILCQIEDIKARTCYMDVNNPLFECDYTVREMVEKALFDNASRFSVKDICSIIPITPFRFERKLSQVGNEKFRCMAAIGYANNKTIYCFPWMSKSRYNYYHRNLTDVLNILRDLGQTVLIPTNFDELPEVYVNQKYYF